MRKDLDTGVLGQGGHDTTGLDVLNEDIFDNPDVTPRHVSSSYSSLPSPGGPMLNQPLPPSHRSSGSQSECSPHPAMQISPAQVPPSPHQMQSPASVPQSPATHPFATPSPAQPPSPANYLPMKSPAHLPPPPSPANLPPPSPANLPPPSPANLPPPSPANLPPPSPANLSSQPSPANIQPVQSPASAIPPSSPANKHYNIKSPVSGAIAPKSPRGGNNQIPQVLSSQSLPLPQNSVILAPTTPGSGTAVLPPGASIVPGNVLPGNQLGMQQLQLNSGSTIVSGGQVFQIQLQPNNSMHGVVTNTIASKPQASQSSLSAKGNKQPHLLPKPITNNSSQSAAASISGQTRLSNSIAAAPSQQPLATVPNVSMAQTQHSIIINSNGVISGVQPGTGVISGVQAGTAPIIMGQMVTPTAGAAAPMIIQQPAGGPMLVLRPNAPLQTTPTIVPIAAQSGLPTGQLILQQGGQARGILASNQQVKLIPQNQVQMQQIQTPTGPKLIALPIGQTIMPGQNLMATTSSGLQLATGSLQLQATPNINLSNSSVIAATPQQGMPIQTAQATVAQQGPALLAASQQPAQGITLQTAPPNITLPVAAGAQHNLVTSISSANVLTTSSSQPLVSTGSTATGITADSVIQQNKFYDPGSLSPKKKKSKKKKKDVEEVQALPAQPNSTSAQKTFDLGALMKDAGLDIDDLDSFSMDQGTAGTTQIDQAAAAGPQMDLGFTPANVNLSTSHQAESSGQLLAPVNPLDMLQTESVAAQVGQGQQQQQQAAPGQIVSNQMGHLISQHPAQIVGQTQQGQVYTQTGQVVGQQAGQIGQQAGQIGQQAGQIGQTLSSGDLSMSNQQHQQLTNISNIQITSNLGSQTSQASRVQSSLQSQISNANSQVSNVSMRGQIIGQQQPGGDTLQVNSGLPPGSSFQLTRGPDGQFILQAAPAATTEMPGATASASTASLSHHHNVPESAAAPTTVTPPRSSPRSAPRNRQPTDPNRTPLMKDETLPHGWHRKVSQRKSGASAGRYEVFIIGPSGKRFRSRNELKSFFEKTGETTLNPDDFDFSTFGRNNAKGVSQSPSTSKQPTLSSPNLRGLEPHPPTVSSSTPSTSMHTSSSSTSSLISPESELIKKLEVTGMASVAAARALETAGNLNTRNNLLQNIQQPLPQSALISPPALDLPHLETRTVVGQQPPRLDTTTQDGGAGPPVTRGHVEGRLQVGETSLQDADEQISNLLKSLHQQPVQVKQEADAGRGEATSSSAAARPGKQHGSLSLKSPEPPVINSMTHSVVKSNLFSDNAHSPSMPVLLPQVPVTAEQQTTAKKSQQHPGGGGVTASRIQEASLQNTYLDSLARSQIADKKARGRTSSGSVQSPGSRLPPMLSPPPSSTSHDSPQQQQAKQASVIHQNPRFETGVSPKSEAPPVSISIQTSSLGGAGSQIRAMQHAPPNTRLVRGPNGQVTVQKVQTIELSQDMQRTFKIVAQRISDIERKAVKTPADEAELASLQAKQHQILSTGRPVATQPVPSSSMKQPDGRDAPVLHSVIQGAAPQPPQQAGVTIPGGLVMSTPMVGQVSAPSGVVTNVPAGTQSHIVRPGGATGLRMASSTTPTLMLPTGPAPVAAPGHIISNSVVAPVHVVGPGVVRPQIVATGQVRPAPVISSIQSIQGSGLRPVPPSQLKAMNTQPINPALPDLKQRLVPDPRVAVPPSFNKSTQPVNIDSEVKFVGSTPGILAGPPTSLLPGPPPGHSQPLPRAILQQPQSTVPPLTEAQKKIVAEFKAKIANLPSDQQQAFISANKMNLLKRLNFHPSQLHILQGNRPPQPAQVVRPSIPVVDTIRPGAPQFVGTALPPLVPVRPAGPPDLQPPQPNSLGAAVDTKQKAMPNINKAKKIAWVESQIKKDQHEAVNPNYKTPFRGKEDASKRLLRYHVFDEPNMTLKEWEDSEEEFSTKSVQLLGKYESMLSKYHILLLQESTRLCSSSEEVMLARQWEADERNSLSKEKDEFYRREARIKFIESKPEMNQEDVEELDVLVEESMPSFPSLPLHWHAKYEQVIGKPYEENVVIKEHLRDKLNTKKTESIQPLTPIQDIEFKKENDNSEMPVLEDETLYQHPDMKLSVRSRNSSQTSIDSFKSGQESVSSSRKELRVSLTNILSAPHLRKELQETGSIQSSSSRPHSVNDMSSPEPSGFVGLKFNRSTSGRWSTSLKRDLDTESPLPPEHHHHAAPADWKKSRTESPHFGSDSDDDFSLADVRGGDAVQSMLSREEEEEEMDMGEQSRNNVGEAREQGTHRDDLRYYSPTVATGGGFQETSNTPVSEPGDSDSVQNAINSILDMHGRGGMQTPDDLNNLTGLLDSMEEEDGEEGQENGDPSLDAAVKSIQGLF